MRKKRFVIVLFLVLIFFRPAFKEKWERAVFMAKYFNFSIINENLADHNADDEKKSGITLAQAEEIQKMNQEDDKAMPMAFYIEKEDQTIINQEFERKLQGKVFQAAGNTGLLFPNDTLLLEGDEKGCLISRELAFLLYGDGNPQGRMVKYKDKEYAIRGIIKSDELVFVCLLTGSDHQIVDSMKIMAPDYQSKESFVELARGAFGLQLIEETTWFQWLCSIPQRLPNRMSDFAEWGNFLKHQ